MQVSPAASIARPIAMNRQSAGPPYLDKPP